MAALLPWRRSKFVLVEQEEKKDKYKGKSLGLSLNYTSLLSNLVRSCPDLWPPYPFERWGAVFRSRRQKVELNKEDPTYAVWYLGNAVTLQAKGTGCTDQAVDKIWAKSEFGGHSTKMKLTLGLQGIHMRPGEREAHRPGHAYLLHRITYCGADGRHPKIFTWVYRHQVKNKAVVLRCHAVLLSKAEEAQAMALLLYQTSYSAFNEFKRLQRQSDARRLQRKLLGEAIVPLVPLRRLLNSKCPYRPPLDRSRSAPRLSAIQEEKEEEEEESPRKTERLATARALGFPRYCVSQAAACGWFATQTVICTVGSFGLGDPDHTSSDHKAAAIIQDAKTTGCQEQPEMQILAREFRFFTLQRPLPVVGTTSWKPLLESPCLSY